MERVSNEQAVAPQNSALLARVLAARLFAGYLLPEDTGAVRDRPMPPRWLERLREQAESWDSLAHAPNRLHAVCPCHPSHLCKCFRRYYDETPYTLEHKLAENVWWLIELANRLDIDIEQELENFLTEKEQL